MIRHRIFDICFAALLLSVSSVSAQYPSGSPTTIPYFQQRIQNHIYAQPAAFLSAAGIAGTDAPAERSLTVGVPVVFHGKQVFLTGAVAESRSLFHAGAGPDHTVLSVFRSGFIQSSSPQRFYSAAAGLPVTRTLYVRAAVTAAGSAIRSGISSNTGSAGLSIRAVHGMLQYRFSRSAYFEYDISLYNNAEQKAVVGGVDYAAGGSMYYSWTAAAGYTYNRLHVRSAIACYNMDGFSASTTLTGLETNGREGLNSHIRGRLIPVLSPQVGIEYLMPHVPVMLRAGFGIDPNPAREARLENSRKLFTAGFGYTMKSGFGFEAAYRRSWWKPLMNDELSGMTISDEQTYDHLFTSLFYRF